MTSSENATDNKGYSLLSHLDSPADLRQLPVTELPKVCDQVRRFLIDSLSTNPGHFASSMGAVELTVALHYVFNTPYDRIVWDVGHQAYSHKLLTGRREAFANNRKLNGLSGFPNPDESEYDTFSAGHASNSISAALGMAIASRMQSDKPTRKVVAVIGDASISGGLAFEGLNNAANTDNDLLIILNDNNMSIDPNVGALHTYLAQITTSKGYNNLRYKLYRLLKKLHIVSENRKGAILRLNNSLKAFLTREHNIFEGLNIRYFGPVDGHDIGQLVKTLNDIKDMSGPKLLHIKTVKGKGYEPAEKNPSVWHAPGTFDPATGVRTAEVEAQKAAGSNAAPKPANYQDIFGKTLLELARKDRRIVGITAAMPSGTSISVMQAAMPDRVFDVGISEEHAVTFAGGLAREGMKPFVAIYSAFLQRAYDQIINDVSITRLPVTFCIDRGGLVGEDGVTHHGIFDMAYMRAIPGMVVASPRNAETLRNLLYTAVHHDGPMSIRYPRGKADTPFIETPLKKLEIGKGERLCTGKDAAVITIGPLASEATKAIEKLREEGLNVAHYDMTFLKPIDTELLDEIIRLDLPIVTVEDGTVTGGLGTAVAEYLVEKEVTLPLRKLGIPDRFVAQGTVAELRKLCGMDSDAIAAAVKSVISKKAVAQQ